MSKPEARLLMQPNGWTREFLRPDGAEQIGAAVWIEGDCAHPIEIRLGLPSTHHVMPFGWQERARAAAEEKLETTGYPPGGVMILKLSDTGSR